LTGSDVDSKLLGKKQSNKFNTRILVPNGLLYMVCQPSSQNVQITTPEIYYVSLAFDICSYVA